MTGVTVVRQMWGYMSLEFEFDHLTAENQAVHVDIRVVGTDKGDVKTRQSVALRDLVLLGRAAEAALSLPK